MIPQRPRNFEHRSDLRLPGHSGPPALIHRSGDLVELPADGSELLDRLPTHGTESSNEIGAGLYACPEQSNTDIKSDVFVAHVVALAHSCHRWHILTEHTLLTLAAREFFPKVPRNHSRSLKRDTSMR